MNISSIVVHTYSQERKEMQEKLADLPGVDVHATMDDGRIIITVEDTPESVPSDILMEVQNMKGVLSAAMVYNYSDELLTQIQE